MTDTTGSAPPGRPARLRPAWIAPAVVTGMVGLLLTSLLPRNDGPPSEPSPSAVASPSVNAIAAVPWLDATPGPGPTAVPFGASACTKAGVAAEVGWDGATGSLAGEIVVTNVGEEACTLDGYLSVELRSAGQPIEVNVGYGPPPFSRFPLVLGPGQQARSRLLWSNWCGGELADLQVLFAPHGETTMILATPATPAEVGHVTTPRCEAPLVESSLGVFPFESRDPQLAADPQPANAALQPPRSARAGETIAFYVTLTNLGGRVAALRPCPYYVEVLIVHGVTRKETEQQYLLNCEAIGWEIRPGGSVLLQMRYAISAEVAPGPVTLVWRLDPRGPFDAISGIGRTSFDVVAP